jgi:hypothetical protein
MADYRAADDAAPAPEKTTMRAFTLDPAGLRSPGERQNLIGVVLCEEARVDRRRLRKGHRLAEGDLDDLATLGQPIHAVELAPDDVHEDVAGLRLAAAIGGTGLTARGPVQSRVNLVATTKGLLRVDGAAVTALNRLEGIAVFTLPDRLPVVPGRIVAGCKITPVAVPEATLTSAEALARHGAAPVVTVKSFLPLRVGVVTTEGMSGATLARFRSAVESKLAWYGASVLGFEEPAGEVATVVDAFERLIVAGADLILTGGGNTIDPLDPLLLALPEIGARLIKFGAPAHPGSMFWLAYRDDLAILNLASCSMYSKATVADLILPWLMAGERVTLDDLAGLGFGGLLDRGMAFRFPPYETDAADESDEE